jgi:3-deoxy-D-manno-octulosonate 8-phosphate phosphatase KdsC-like HAD superfamily phosphatase
VSDVDGVFCRGKISLQLEFPYKHSVIGREFCDLDWTAIKAFKSLGIKVYLMSSDYSNLNIAEQRNIDFVYSRDENAKIDKVNPLKAIIIKEGTTQDRTIFLGDDWVDIYAAAFVRYSFCPKSAASRLCRQVYHILDRNAGEGVLESLYEYLVRFKFIPEADLGKVIELDAEEYDKPTR